MILLNWDRICNDATPSFFYSLCLNCLDSVYNEVSWLCEDDICYLLYDYNFVLTNVNIDMPSANVYNFSVLHLPTSHHSSITKLCGSSTSIPLYLFFFDANKTIYRYIMFWGFAIYFFCIKICLKFQFEILFITCF